jgi:FK506-binding nuclear protein
MGFFGQVIEEGDVLEVPIPEEYYLHVTQVCVAPVLLEKKKLSGPIVIYVKTANDDSEYAVAVLNPSQNQYHSSISLELGTEDSPITLRASTGSVHVTGKWSWDEDDCCEHHAEGSDEEEDEEEDEASEEDDGSEEDEEEEDEAPMLVEIEDKPEPSSAPTNPKKQKLDETESKHQEREVQLKASTKTEEPVKKKVRIDTPIESVAKESIIGNSALKPWKVYPDSDEGVPVPTPKTIKKGGGFEITDYIIGNGSAPRGGAVVKILYEGLFPNGKVFDQKLKRKSPFSFRKGTGQVIPGMDKGIEGMKIGGAREIVIPPQLG